MNFLIFCAFIRFLWFFQSVPATSLEPFIITEAPGTTLGNGIPCFSASSFPYHFIIPMLLHKASVFSVIQLLNMFIYFFSLSHLRFVLSLLLCILGLSHHIFAVGHPSLFMATGEPMHLLGWVNLCSSYNVIRSFWSSKFLHFTDYII